MSTTRISRRRGSQAHLQQWPSRSYREPELDESEFWRPSLRDRHALHSPRERLVSRDWWSTCEFMRSPRCPCSPAWPRSQRAKKVGNLLVSLRFKSWPDLFSPPSDVIFPWPIRHCGQLVTSGFLTLISGEGSRGNTRHINNWPYPIRQGHITCQIGRGSCQKWVKKCNHFP
jgi:hypothetical protein